MPPHIWSFVGVAVLLVVVPGADTALVTRHTLSGGRRVGLRTLAGTGLGLLVHAGAAAAGLSAVIATSASAFTAVKLVGAAFLVWMGLTTLAASRRGEAIPSEEAPGPDRGVGRDPLLQGFLTNVLNPKLSVFFLSLLPQFVAPDTGSTRQILVLSAVFIGIGGVWLGSYVMAIDRLSGLLERPRVRTIIDRATGVTLVALGARLAFVRAD